MARYYWIIFTALSALMCAELRADSLVLTNGERIACTIVEETDTAYRIEHNGIETTIPRSRVQSAERAPAASGYDKFHQAVSTESGYPVLFLSDLFPSFAEQAWGELHFDASVENHPLRIGGRSYQKGLGTHAASSLTFAINRQARRFRATVGIDDEVLSNESQREADVRFLVYGDGKLLYSSKIMRSGSSAEEIDIAVDRVRELTLRIDDLGHNTCDHADWANARLLLNSTGASAALRRAARAAWNQATASANPSVSLQPEPLAKGAKLAYKIRVTNPASGTFDVALTVNNFSIPALNLTICRDIGQIENVTATSGSSEALTVRYADPGSWEVSTLHLPTITMAYRVNARMRDPEQTRAVYPMDLNEAGGCIDGWTTFLYPSNVPIGSITVACELPEGWRMVAPWYDTAEGWRCDRVYPRRHLTDAVCVIGYYQEVRQKFGSTEFVVAYPLKHPGESASTLLPPDEVPIDTQDCLKICEYFQREFNGFPFEKYAIMLRPEGTRGEGSGAFPSGFIVPDSRKGADLGWLAHEICHAAAIGGDQWCNEGMAMYYQALVPDTLGLTHDSLKQRSAADFERLKTLHAEGKDRSVAELSQSGEAKRLYWTTGDLSLLWFTYNKAALIFFIIDQRLRLLSDDQRSLADLIRYVKAHQLRPTNHNLVHVLNQVCAEINSLQNSSWEIPDLSEWNWAGFFNTYVLGDALLPVAGYQLFYDAHECWTKENVEEARISFEKAHAAFLKDECPPEASACTRWIQRCNSAIHISDAHGK
jgi:predicted metalloprotease with PDZ domain